MTGNTSRPPIPRMSPDTMDMYNLQHVVEALLGYFVFLFSTTLHEAAHAWVAKRGGDDTAYLGGQVSMDPLPHIRREPFGMVVLPLLTALLSGWPIGFASVPYDPLWAQRYPRRAAWMSLAGPGANLLLVLTAGLLIRCGIAFDVFYAPNSLSMLSLVAAHSDGIWAALAFLLSIVFSMNLLLFVLNILPIPPLDGSGALPLLLTPRATEHYQNVIAQPVFSWCGLLLAWHLLKVIFQPCFLTAVHILYANTAYYG